MSSNLVSPLTEEEYLAIERAAEHKSEFLNGEMFAMSGASLRHGRLQQNLSSELYVALRGSGCQAFSSGLRVKVSASAMYAYPDVLVVCGKPLLVDSHQDTLLSPGVICEILSPSTESYDRGLKFQHYRTIESLKDYLLLDQSKVRIEHFTRQAGAIWTLRDYQNPDEELKLDSVGVSIPLNRIYDGVEFGG